MGFVVAILGLLLIAGVVWRTAVLYQRSKWPTASGTVTRSSVIEVPTAPDENGKRIKEWRLAIRYDFQYRGKPMEGCALSFNRVQRATKAAVEKQHLQFPEGAKVKVFINPDDPKECSLDRGYGAGAIILLSSGIVSGFLMTGVGLALIMGSR